MVLWIVNVTIVILELKLQRVQAKICRQLNYARKGKGYPLRGSSNGGPLSATKQAVRRSIPAYRQPE